jgi:GT2 family glycosyltransferase
LNRLPDYQTNDYFVMPPSLEASNQPLVYVIILNWNQLDLTLDCLRSLEKSDDAPFKVILVDNGSTGGSAVGFANGTAQAIAAIYPHVTVLPQAKNLGFCAANNIGIRRALGEAADYILLLNNDTLVAPNMLRLLVHACESDARIAMAGPLMFYYDRPETIAAAGGRVDLERAGYWNLHAGQRCPDPAGQPIENVDFIVSCGLLVRRAALERLGALDPRFFINGDDVDWGLRATAAGYHVVLVPAARLWHRVSAAIGPASPASTYYTTRNQFLIFGKHLQGWRRLRAWALIAVRTLRTLLAWSLKPRYRSLHRHRDANLLALRDALLRRYGQMGPDVARICSRK